MQIAHTAPSKEILWMKSHCEEDGVEQTVLVRDVLLGNPTWSGGRPWPRSGESSHISWWLLTTFDGCSQPPGMGQGVNDKRSVFNVPCRSALVHLSLIPHHGWLRPLPRGCSALDAVPSVLPLCTALSKGLITFLKKIILGLQQKIQGLSLDGGCCARVKGLQWHPAIAAGPTNWPHFHTSPPLFILLHVFQNCPRLYTPCWEINFQRNTHREIHVQNMFFCCQKKNNKWLGRRENTFPD